MFCVKCGSTRLITDNLCGACYAEVSTLARIPSTLTITTCAHCSSYLEKKKWKHFKHLNDLMDQRIMAHLMVDSLVDVDDVELSHKMEDEHRREIGIRIAGKVDTTDIEEQLRIKVMLKKGVCERCSKIAGKYYESILQVRGEDSALDKKTMDEIRKQVHDVIARTAKKDRNSFISREGEMHSGLDFYLGKNGDGKNLAKLLGSVYGSKITESKTLVGRKEGKDCYRMTYLVRVPPFLVGDFVMYDKEPWRIERINPRKVTLLGLQSGERITMDRSGFTGFEILGGAGIIEKVVVVSGRDGSRDIIVLHPQTYRSMEVIVPASLGIPEPGSEIDAIIHGDEIFLV